MGGLGQFADLMGLGRKGRGGDVFEWGVATPMHTMDMPIFVSYCFEVR